MALEMNLALDLMRLMRFIITLLTYIRLYAMLTSKDAMNLVNKGKNEKIFLILALSLNIFALQLDEISNTMQKYQ